MGVSGFFGKRNIYKIDVEIEAPEEIYAQTAAPFKVRLLNKRRFMPAFLICVNIGSEKMLFPFVDRASGETKYISMSFGERGGHDVGDVYLSSVFPFNFFVRYRKCAFSERVTVFPNPRRSEWLSLPVKQRNTRGERPSNKAGYEADMLSMRSYAYGDPLKYIHWKASARTGRLTTKELSSLTNQPVLIDMEKIPIKNIEERVSAAAYLILKLLRKGVPVGFRTGGRMYKPEVSHSHKLALLKELAFYGKG